MNQFSKEGEVQSINFIFAKDVESAVVEEECRKLAELAIEKEVLELGTWRGRSRIALAGSAKVVHTVDWHKGDALSGVRKTFIPLMANLEKYNVQDKVIVHVGDIPEVVGRFKEALFDLVFIDAFHEKQAVVRDIGLTFPLLRKGGVMAFHDYGLRKVANGIRLGVTEAVDEFAKAHGFKVESVRTLAFVRT